MLIYAPFFYWVFIHSVIMGIFVKIDKNSVRPPFAVKCEGVPFSSELHFFVSFFVTIKPQQIKSFSFQIIDYYVYL